MIDDSVMISKKTHASEEESNAECTSPKEIIGISCFSQPPTGHAKHKEIIRKSLIFVMRGRFFQEYCNRMKISEEDSCFGRGFHE